MGPKLLEGLEFLTGFEANCPAGGDVHFLASAGIAADAGLARFDGEDTEAAQLNPVTLRQRTLHRGEDGVYGRLGLVPRQPGPFHDALDEILLDQAGTPFG